MSLRLLVEANYALTAPAFDAQNNLYAACTQSGAILRFDAESKAFAVAMETEGQPQQLAIDPASNEVFFADAGRSAVIKVEAQQDGSMEMTEFVQQFEGRGLIGPCSLAFTADRELVVADSGSSGDTGLSRPTACVYRTVQSRQQLVRLSGANLAYASAIAVGPNGVIYVAEQGANRILRYVQRPEGVYQGAVFAQLAGTLGPVSLAVHPSTGDLYVAMYDLKSVASEGTIRVFEPTGAEKGVIATPTPEVVGVAFDREGSSLYIVESADAGSSRIYALDVPAAAPAQ